jgi:DNA polymerase delta subunit 1
MAGVPLDMIVRRGLQIRLKSFLYRKGRYAPVRHLFYTRTQADRLASAGASYAGAHVETPKIGFHDEVVITLDYKSLYPSIMVTFSMCLKTLIPGNQLAGRKRTHSLSDDDVWMPTTAALPGPMSEQPVFVRSSHTSGLTTEVIRELLNERERVKKLMKAAKNSGDETMVAIYDKRQLAIKLNCNSIYGVYGAPSSFAYCPEIAAMVTAYGRDMILETKSLVERLFTISNGFPFNAEVVYGDTDSVFVKLHVPAGAVDSDGRPLERVSVEDSAVWGELMARYVTLHFARKYGVRDDNIIELEFEKSFTKIIFYAKKRYVGWKWILTALAKLERDRPSSVCMVDSVLDRMTTTTATEMLTAADKHTRKVLNGQAMQRESEPNASGMETERRDSCLLVSRGVKRVVEMLLADNSTRVQALEQVRSYIIDEMVAPIESNTVSWANLIQSKQFRMRLREYTQRGQTPPIHIVLAAKLDRRLGENAPGTYQPGDRVQYVVTSETEPGQKTSECGESPDYAWEHQLPLSRDHYIDRQVHGTMTRVLEPILLQHSVATLDSLNVATNVSSSSQSETVLKRKRQNEAKDAYTLFIQQYRRHKRQRQVGINRSSPLDMLMQRTRVRCRLCGAVGTESICANHTDEELRQLDEDHCSKRRRLNNERSSLWRTCTACTQGWRVEDDSVRAEQLVMPDIEDAIESVIECKNSSCDIYWQRRMNDRVRSELEESGDAGGDDDDPL